MSEKRTIAVLERLADLAARGGAEEVARALPRVASLVNADRQEGARRIAAMYGGAGSLNDVILYRDGRPLMGENREFDDLRRELFDLALELRGIA